MDYTYQVARLNAIRAYKIIPKNVLEELDSSDISDLISIFKEYKYNKIFTITNPEIDIKDTRVFNSVLITELDDTVYLLYNLFHKQHKWLSEWFKYFYVLMNVDINNSQTNFNLQRISWYKKYTSMLFGLKSKLIDDITKFIIDFENIKLFCSLSLMKENFEPEKLEFIPNGKIPNIKYKDFFPSLEQLKKYLDHTEYSGTKLDFDQDETIYFYQTKFLMNLISNTKFYFFTIEPLICYFFEKLFETQKLKEAYFNSFFAIE